MIAETTRIVSSSEGYARGGEYVEVQRSVNIHYEVQAGIARGQEARLIAGLGVQQNLGTPRGK
jgi:hypothetical protein